MNLPQCILVLYPPLQHKFPVAVEHIQLSVIPVVGNVHTFLQNFAWFDYIRPRDKYDLFEWRGKKKESKLKESVRRQAPVQHLKSQKKKKENE